MMKIVKFLIIMQAIAAIVLLTMFALPGCEFGQRINQARAAFMAENPTANTIRVDEDGDGTIDFLGVDADGDLRVDVDSSGKPVEVSGTRGEYAKAGNVDLGINELLALAGAITGFPAVGLIGAWWGKRKPASQLTDMVVNFEEARLKTSGPEFEGAVTFSTDILHRIKNEKPELYALIRDIRKSIKK